MKVAIHLGYGGFVVPNSALSFFRKNYRKDFDIYDLSYAAIKDRTHPVLLKAVDLFTDDFHKNGIFIATVPDEATDVRILDYDGTECIIYVADGKIKDLEYDRIEK